MVDKITLANVTTFINDGTAVSTVNNNSALITTAFDNTLSRDGTSPNQMNSNLDMNSNNIINLPPPATINSPARLIDVVTNPTITVPPTGSSGHTVPFLDTANTWSATQTFNSPETFGSTVTVAGASTFNGFATFNAGTNLAFPTPSAANKIVFVSPNGSDANDGLSWGTPKLTLQAAQNLANPNGVVYMASGTYSLSSALNIQPGVRMSGASGSIITQNNGANLNPMISFQANSANGASIDHCIIDGNRANNTDAAGAGLINMILIGTANDVVLDSNTIRNSNGSPINISTGLRPIIKFNKISNFFDQGISLATNVNQTQTYAQIIDNSFTAPIGFHPIYIQQSDFNTIARNTINCGNIAGIPGNLLRISTSGTTVTWQSGPQFNTVSAGQILVVNQLEFLVTVVNSNTVLTIATSAGTLTNVLAAIGPGDLISINNASYMEICDNTTFGGVTGSIVCSNFPVPAGETCQKINIHGNNIINAGEFGVYIASVSGGSQVNDIKVYGNLIVDTGQAGAAAPQPLCGIGVQGTAINNISIDNNTIRDDQGAPTTAFWLLVGGTNAGQVFCGSGNYYNGTINLGISNAISSIVLSAGWGTTASTSAIQSEGNSVLFTITASGTGQGANPTIAVNTVATKTNPNLIVCKQVGGSGTYTSFTGESASTKLQLVSTFVGTPTASATYTVLFE